MNKEKCYWKWKNTIIDFNAISDEKDEYSKCMTKKDIVFHYLGIPDEDIHEWYSGGYSSEYNTALRYAKELGLVEDYIDYEEIRYQLEEVKQEMARLNNKNLELIVKLNNQADEIERLNNNIKELLKGE